MTDIGTEELNVKLPLIEDPPLNGALSRNAASCPLAGMVVLPVAKLTPFASVKKNVTVATWLFGFAMASPVFTGPPASA